MTDKDLYYDKYLKYKNKYLDLKVQIGGTIIWTIKTINFPHRKIYKAINRTTSIEREIFIKYHYTTKDTLKIIIKDNDINIDLDFPLISTLEEYFKKNEHFTNSIYEFKNRDELKTQFILAIQYIIKEIKETEKKEFIINSIETFMLLDDTWSNRKYYTPTNIFYETTNVFIKENIIRIEYKKTNDTHILKIIIKYYDNINIELYLTYSQPSIEEITRTSLIGIDLFNKNVELQKQFILAIEYITNRITATEVQSFIFESIRTVLYH